MFARIAMVCCWVVSFAVSFVGFGLWVTTPTHAAAEDETKKIALLVGVNKSEIRIFADHPLQFAERDVQDLTAVLGEQGFAIKTLTGPEATKEKIEGALAAILKGR